MVQLKEIKMTLGISKPLNTREKLTRRILPPSKPDNFCIKQFFIRPVILKLFQMPKIRESPCISLAICTLVPGRIVFLTTFKILAIFPALLGIVLLRTQNFSKELEEVSASKVEMQSFSQQERLFLKQRSRGVLRASRQKVNSARKRTGVAAASITLQSVVIY